MSKPMPDTFNCFVCHGTVKHPVQLPCRHPLCLSCAFACAQKSHAKTKIEISQKRIAKSRREAFENCEDSVQDNVEDGGKEGQSHGANVKTATEDKAKDGKTEAKPDQTAVNADEDDAETTFPCPVCATAVPFNFAKVELGLAADEALKMAVEQFGVGVCGECKTPTQLVCTPCGVRYCKDCFEEAHSENTEHKLEKSDSVVKEVVKDVMKCSVHPAEDATLFCEKDKVAVCPKCVKRGSGTHGDMVGNTWISHLNDSLSGTATETSIQLSQRIEHCEERLRVVTAARGKIMQVVDTLNKSYPAVCESINSHIDAMIGRLERVRAAKLADAKVLWHCQRTCMPRMLYLWKSRVTLMHVQEGRRVKVVPATVERAYRILTRLTESAGLCGPVITPVCEGKVEVKMEKSDEIIERMMKSVSCSGDPGVMARVGMMYHHGLGVTVDYGKAMEWYKKAADGNSADAMNAIGSLYENALGVAQDYAKAKLWYTQASDKGSAEARNNLGQLYYNGFGVTRDYHKAMDFYKDGAVRGCAQASFNIAAMYEHGVGVSRDTGQAIAWYKRAVERGHEEAKKRLAKLRK